MNLSSPWTVRAKESLQALHEHLLRIAEEVENMSESEMDRILAQDSDDEDGIGTASDVTVTGEKEEKDGGGVTEGDGESAPCADM